MLQSDMTFAIEKNLPYLRSVAKALQDENARLRAELKTQFDQSVAAIAAKTEVESLLHDVTSEMRVAKAIQEENAHLHADLKTQLDQLVAAMEAKTEAESRLHDMASEVKRLEQELQVLREQLDRRSQALFGRKSERRPPDPAGTDGSEPADAAGQEAKEKKKAKRKARHGHGPTAQPGLERATVVHELTGDSLSCENCGGLMAAMGTAAEEAELVAIELRKIVLETHIRTKYQCPCCHLGVKIAPGSSKLIPGGRYALNFAVEVAYSKFLGHLPLDRQVQMMKHEGLQVTTATLFEQTDALATALTPTYQEILRRVQAEPVLRADETPWAVLSNGYNENERFYVWVVVGSQYVVYRMLDSRSKEAAESILGAFAGTLMVDGLTSYPAAAKSADGQPPKFKVGNCMAHARRYFVECQKHYPAEVLFVLDLFRQLYAIERQGKEPGADLGALRVEKSRPLVDAIFVWAKEQQARLDLLPSGGLMKALNYLVNHEAGLRVFLEDPNVPIDNNESERSLRGPVLGRKNHYGSRSRRGAETAAILYTLVESAKRVGVNPKAYLEAAAEFALTKAGATLMPDEFKRQLDAVRDLLPDTA